jgi:hypothetical protein
MSTSRDAGVGLPAFFAFFHLRRRIREIVASGIVSRVLYACIARNGKKIIGNQRNNAAAVLALEAPALRWVKKFGLWKRPPGRRPRWT